MAVVENGRRGKCRRNVQSVVDEIIKDNVVDSTVVDSGAKVAASARCEL